MPAAQKAKQQNGRIDLENYVTVAERIAKFYAIYPEGVLRSEIMVDDGKRVLIRATAYRSRYDDLPAVGHAEEIRGQGPVNRTSAIENCETSAVGRSLAMLGMEVTRGIASREEIQQAEANAAALASIPKVETIDATTVGALNDKYEAAKPEGEEREAFMKGFAVLLGSLGVTGASKVGQALATLTPAQAAEVEKWLGERASPQPRHPDPTDVGAP